MKAIQLFIVPLLLITIQNSWAQQIESSTIYELEADEKIIHNNETRLNFQGDGKGYLLFIQKKGLHYMVQDGKRIGPYDLIYDPEIDADEYGRTSFYHFIYHYRKKKHVNINGKSYGPYDQIGPKGGWYHLFVIDDEHFLFTFTRDGEAFVNVNGKEFGPYDKVFNYYTTYKRDLYLDKDGNYAFRYLKNKKYYFHINGKDYGPYDDFDEYKDNLDFSQIAEGRFEFSANINGEKYYVIDGKEMGPYQAENRSTLKRNRSNGDFLARVIKNQRQYILHNGEEVGPFERVINWGLAEDLIYYEYLKDGKNYIKINAIEYGPQGKTVASTFQANDNWFYIYTDPQNPLNHYLRLNGQPPIGPYEWIDQYNVKRNQRGSTGFVFQKNQEYFIYMNGKEIGPYPDQYMGLELLKGLDFTYSFRDKKGREYFVMNEKEYGPFAEIKDFSIKAIDPEHFCFMYRKDLTKDEWYLNVNGKKKGYGPYKNIYAHFDEQKNICFRATKMVEVDGKEVQRNYIYSRGIEYGPYKYAYFQGNTADFNYTDEEGNKFQVVQDQISPILSEEGGLIKLEVADSDYSLAYQPNTSTVYLNNQKIGKIANAFGFQFYVDEQAFFCFSLDGNKLKKHRIKVN
jgi:hypothetical protein